MSTRRGSTTRDARDTRTGGEVTGRSAPGRTTLAPAGASERDEGSTASELAGGRYPGSGIWPSGDSATVSPASLVDRSVDSHDIIGNTLSATSAAGLAGRLDERSERRLYERLAELARRDPRAAGEEFAAMDPDARRDALRRAVTAFQAGHAEEIEQIVADNDVEDYHRPSTGALSRFDAPEASYTAGEARPNDATMQAIANSWPQTILGRSMNEEQAYTVLRRLVLGRGLPFDPATVNVIGIRGFQGEMHDNGEPEGRVFTEHNRYDDTIYLVSNREGPSVQRARGTVDPGGGRGGRDVTRFQVAADQQWDYAADGRVHSDKFDRPMYGLRGADVDPLDVRRGHYWRAREELVERADAGSFGRGPHGGRLYRRPSGSLALDRLADGRANTVSALHSGNSGGDSGERVAGDSTGCTVIHGEWYAHFNESLRRETGSASPRFTYSMIDLRTYSAGELTRILDSVVPESSAGPASSGGRRIAADVESIPEAGPGPTHTP